jgi:putative heme-binding domain-containing protein
VRTPGHLPAGEVLMMWTRTVTGIAVLAAAAAWAAGRGAIAQEVGHGMTPADLERGGQLYMSGCASCHGPDGDVVPGANLASGTFRRATTDQELAAIVRGGVPGTAMPPSAISEADAARVVAYLRSLPALRRAGGASGLRGSPVAGKAIFDGKGGCLECHLANGAGGFLGPDLSSVGLTRRVEELERALTEPSADIRTGSRAVVVVRHDGTTVTGRLLNQDTYSLQLIDAQGRLFSVDKSAVRTWDVPNESVMPNYTQRLTPTEIADVVSYLRTLQAPVPAAPAGRRGGGAGGGGAGGPR